MPFIKEDINIPSDKLALVTAVPVILGSLLRIPLGYYANQFGARVIFMLSFILLLFPVYYISIADSITDLLIGDYSSALEERYSLLGLHPFRSITQRSAMGL